MMSVFNHAPSAPEKKPVNRYKLGHAIRLSSAKDMMAAKFSQQMLDAIKPLTSLPDDYFAPIYLKLLNSFASYVSVLPKHLDLGLGSLFTRSVYGAYFALQKFAQEKPNSDCLLRFAVFSAALLKHMHLPARDFQVIITDVNGNYVSRWNPFQGSLEDQGAKYCKLYTQGSLFYNNYAILMGMVLTQVMPIEALSWLQSNGDLFAQWLDCLQSEVQVEGMLGEALEMIRDEEDLLAEYDDAIQVDLIETPETEPGEILDQWIRDGIADGSIKINTPDANVFIVHDGVSEALFVEPGAAKNMPQKIAHSPTMMAAAVSMFYALFGPNEQHTLAFTMPGLTKRGSGLMGGAMETRVLKNGHFSDASSYFGKGQIPAAYQFAKDSQKQNTSVASLDAILGQTVQQTRVSYRPGMGR